MANSPREERVSDSPIVRDPAGRAQKRALGVAVVDAFGGAAGDMLLGALVDLGVDPAALEAALRTLDLPGWTLSTQEVTRAHLRCRKITFEVAEEHSHRHLPEIRKIIVGSVLPDSVKERAVAVFEGLARAEARSHGIEVEKVHFHEVGAADAILDICGVSWALDALGIGELWVAPMPAGRGTIECAHGTMPCPVPAVTELLSNFELRVGRGEGEMITPTGAALLAHFGKPLSPEMAERCRSGASGYGGGSRAASILRIWRVEPVDVEGEGIVPASTLVAGATDEQADMLYQQLSTLGLEREWVQEFRSQIDDANGEELGFLAEQLFAAGALDVHFSPTYMKKGRPAHTLSCLVAQTRALEAHDMDSGDAGGKSEGATLDRATSVAGAVAQVLIRHSSTLGFRLERVQRWVLPRRMTDVQTPWGRVRIKLAWREGAWVPSTEYEDCAALAREQGVSLLEVQRAALIAYAKQERAYGRDRGQA